MSDFQQRHMPTVEEAKAIMGAGLGRAELELAISVSSPLYWVTLGAGNELTIRNGTCFFLDTGEGIFGVTAAHVIRELQAAKEQHNNISCQLGGELSFDLGGKNALIAIEDEIDIATFRVAPAEVEAIGKTILTGDQRKWPPAPPQEGRGIYYCGFLGASTMWLSEDEISFGAAAGGGVASSVSDSDVSTLIERENLIDVFGGGLLPENYNFGGMSGGPMLSVVETAGLRTWRLAGVIYEGPNPSGDPDHAIAGLEIIRARRADYLLPNGKLDVSAWQTRNL